MSWYCDSPCPPAYVAHTAFFCHQQADRLQALVSYIHTHNPELRLPRSTAQHCVEQRGREENGWGVSGKQEVSSANLARPQASMILRAYCRNSASSPMAAALAKNSCTSPCTSSTSRHQVWSQIMSLQHPQIGKSHSIPTPPMSPAQQNFDGAPVCRLKGTAGVKRHRRHLHSITFTLAIGSVPHTRPA